VTEWLSPAQDAAMRADAVPPLSAGFADRVMAALPVEREPLPQTRPARGRRGGWARASIALMVTAGAGLVSMAAASTIFGVPIRNMPVVGTFVERVAPAPKVAARAVKPKPKADAPASRPAPVAEAMVEPAPTMITRRELQREVVAQRIADRIDRMQARRREQGLPPAPLKLNPQMRERLKAMPPEDRRALMQRVRDVRRERGTAKPALTPEQKAARRAAWQQMTPEERQALREKRAQRRANRVTTPATSAPGLTRSSAVPSTEVSPWTPGQARRTKDAPPGKAQSTDQGALSLP
jgi:hypothetical protein